MQQTKDGRPKPPADLTSTQKKYWTHIVTSEASSTFESPSNQLLLVELVRHAQTATFLAKSIEQIEASGLTSANLKLYADLQKQREAATRCITSLATKLRLTNQSRYTPQAAATASKVAGSSNPWDFK